MLQINQYSVVCLFFLYFKVVMEQELRDKFNRQLLQLNQFLQQSQSVKDILPNTQEQLIRQIKKIDRNDTHSIVLQDIKQFLNQNNRQGITSPEIALYFQRNFNAKQSISYINLIMEMTSNFVKKSEIIHSNINISQEIANFIYYSIKIVCLKDKIVKKLQKFIKDLDFLTLTELTQYIKENDLNINAKKIMMLLTSKKNMYHPRTPSIQYCQNDQKSLIKSKYVIIQPSESLLQEQKNNNGDFLNLLSYNKALSKFTSLQQSQRQLILSARKSSQKIINHAEGGYNLEILQIRERTSKILDRINKLGSNFLSKELN